MGKAGEEENTVVVANPRRFEWRAAKAARPMPRPTLPSLTRPIQALPSHAVPSRTVPSLSELILPNQLSPVGRYDAGLQCAGDHASVPWVASQYVTPAAQCPKIPNVVRSELSALNMIDMATIERHRHHAPCASSTVAKPDFNAEFAPQSSNGWRWRAAPEPGARHTRTVCRSHVGATPISIPVHN